MSTSNMKLNCYSNKNQILTQLFQNYHKVWCQAAFLLKNPSDSADFNCAEFIYFDLCSSELMANTGFCNSTADDYE